MRKPKVSQFVILPTCRSVHPFVRHFVYLPVLIAWLRMVITKSEGGVSAIEIVVDDLSTNRTED